MKNLLTTAILAITAAASTQQAQAQMPYNVSTLTQTYQPLPATAAKANQTAIWTNDSNYVIPLGFTFRINGKTTTKIAINGGDYLAPDTTGLQSGFGIISSIMRDRGTTTSLSPIRYATTGAPGSRIFKLELFNAGFDDEFFTFGTNLDSANLQVWLYETSNIVEIRYGGSKVSHFSTYFDKGLQVGFVKNFDKSQGMLEKAYILKGNPASPTIDSFDMNSTNYPAMNAMPANGTVYRFTPKTGSSTGIVSVTSGTIGKIYPTTCANVLNIEHHNSYPIAYQVVSMSGYTVLNGEVTGTSKILDVANLAAGIYQVRLTNNGQTEVQRFVKL
jgi:hypothetical protein